jgi:hypothetical protein
MNKIEKAFLKAWRLEDYQIGEELPAYIELPKEEFSRILVEASKEIEGEYQNRLLEFVLDIRNGKFHGHGFDHPDEPCNCNENAAVNFLKKWGGV